MYDKKIAPCGAWPSALSSDLLASKSLGLSEPKLFGDRLYWLERRPDEGGRSTILYKEKNKPAREIVPLTYDVGSRVHEYGGGAYCVAGQGVFFVNQKDNNIYLARDKGNPEAISHFTNLRFADLQYDQRRSRLVAVCESHARGDKEPENFLVAIAVNEPKTEEPQVLRRGNDFYSSPSIDPGGNHMVWLEWSHPDMPWNKTKVWLAELDESGNIVHPRCINQNLQASAFQPQWSPEGNLYLVSDHTDWWNIYRYDGKNLNPVLTMNAEFGLPQWVFALSTYAFISEHQIACTFVQDGAWKLGKIDLQSRSLRLLDTGYSQINYVHANEEEVVFLGAAPQHPAAIVSYDLGNSRCHVVRSGMEETPESEDISIPEHIQFTTSGDGLAYGYFYRPKNANYTYDKNEKPPLIVRSHGGPTAAADSGFSPKIQFWTSRGFAVLDVNYRGSTGYGRPYRLSLNQAWGKVDVEDCVAGAQYLSQRGEVDKDRLIIAGSSAGGYTTLCALTFADIFKAGASYYGIGDLEALVRDTHKFESHYLDQLVGPYPKERDLYKARSPIHHVGELSCPIIFFQGAEDKVVPPEQAEAMVNALKKKGLPVSYILYSRERHGFRKAESIRESIESEYSFYCRVFGIATTLKLRSVEIVHDHKLKPVVN